jgi:hypothetical protein
MLSATRPTPPLPPDYNGGIDEQLRALTQAFQIASESALKCKGCNPAHSAHWWNDECSVAAGALHTAVSQDDRSTARVHTLAR